MKNVIRTIAIALLAVGFLAPFADRSDAASGLTVYTVDGDFETVALDVSDAIINRGYVIDYTARISDMLDRTAADVGATTRVFSAAQVSQFCSAVVSRKAMEADPENIAFCPYAIFVYELADAPGTIHVGFRRLEGGETEDSIEALEDVNDLLDSIAREAAGVE